MKTHKNPVKKLISFGSLYNKKISNSRSTLQVYTIEFRQGTQKNIYHNALKNDVSLMIYR